MFFFLLKPSVVTRRFVKLASYEAPCSFSGDGVDDEIQITLRARKGGKVFRRVDELKASL